MYSSGWYQVAFERDLAETLTPANAGPLRLVLARTETGCRAFAATCPHRGAHLAFGRLDRGAIVCPFHGYRIGLGHASGVDHGFLVPEYHTRVIGGMVFVRLSDERDHGFAALLEDLDRTHFFVPGFALRIRSPPELVIENAFDNAHFRTVHGIRNEPAFAIQPSQHGELVVEGAFEIPPSPWQRSRPGAPTLRVPFVARTFSPGIVVSELRGDDPYWVITAATATPDGECTVRLSLAAPPAADGRPPNEELCRYLLRQSKAGLEQDRAIWEHLDPDAPARYTPQDAAVLAFRDFCRGFGPESHR